MQLSLFNTKFYAWSLSTKDPWPYSHNQQWHSPELYIIKCELQNIQLLNKGLEGYWTNFDLIKKEFICKIS